MSLLDAIPRDLKRLQATGKGLSREVFFRPDGAPADGSGDVPVRAVFGDVYAPGEAPGGTAAVHGARKELLLHKDALPHSIHSGRGRDAFVIDGVAYDIILVTDDGLSLVTVKLGLRQGRNMPGWEARP